MIRPALLVAVLALAACAQPRTERTPADAARLDACRRQVDATLERRDRALLYRDEAFSNGLGRGDPTRETNLLARRFERDRMIQDCLRSTETGN